MIVFSVVNHIRITAVYLSTKASGIKTHYRFMKSVLVLGKYCFRWFSGGLIFCTSVEEERLVFFRLFVGFLSVVLVSVSFTVDLMEVLCRCNEHQYF